MNKKGQFYLMAAVIIIAIIISIVAINNYANPKEQQTKIYDLSKELGIETGEVISYGIYQKQDTSELIKNWTTQYYQYTQETGVEGSWVFVYGDQSNMTILGFTKTKTGEISLEIGGKKQRIDIPGYTSSGVNFSPEGNNVSVSFQEIKYNLNLKEGQNFFFVIKEGGYAVQG